MELFAGFSDDMIAVCGCIAAFVLCGSLMSLSRFVGRGRRRAEPPAVRRPLAGPRAAVPPAAAEKDDARPPRKRAA
jgi:hypothetical protein